MITYFVLWCYLLIQGMAQIHRRFAFSKRRVVTLRLWGVLCGKIPCPPRPLALVAPVPPTPPVIVADASEADRVAAKTADDVAVDAYDQQVADFFEALFTYRDAQTACTQWCAEDARVAAVLTASVLPQFASEFMALPTTSEMWSHLRQQYQPSGDSGACSLAGGFQC
jgi:hypothetical protein